MRLPSLAVIVFVAFPLTGLTADQADIRSGFSTGEKYMKMTPAQKRYYTMGLVNGMLLAPLFGAPKANMARLENCITNMTDNQISAIFKDHIEKTPAAWDETPHVSLYTGLMDVCAKKGY